MQHLIKNGEAIADDAWLFVTAEDEQALPSKALLPVETWAKNGTELALSSLDFGAFLKEGDEIDGLLPYLGSLKLITFEFSKFADGRAFTQIQQLRAFYQFKGEIRVCGDFLPDQVRYLERVGVDSFACRNEKEVETALAVKTAISTGYQADYNQEQPLFRRR